MQRSKLLWTFLFFSCSSVSVLTDSEFNDKNDGPMDSKWITTENDKDYSDVKTIGLNGDTQNLHQPLDRIKRDPVFSDSGYGSRLQAGSQLADDWLALQEVFGSEGPGKRSDGSMAYDIPRAYILKRDHGYGSRVRAGHNVANSLLARNKLFGIYGPGRKRSQYPIKAVGDSRKMRELVTEAVNMLKHDNSLYDDESIRDDDMDMLKTQKRRLVSDSGYGSRIDAANKLARDLSAIDDVFGVYGPGKKR